MMSLALAVLASTSSPDRVVVFPDRAQVTRATTITCGARVPLTFTDIPPAAAADSFRARVSGGTIDGQRAQLLDQATAFSPRAEALAQRQLALNAERRALEDQLTRARLQGQVGTRYTEVATQAVSREMSQARPDPKAWLVALDGARATALQAARLATEASAKLVDVGRRQDTLSLELEELHAAQGRRAWVVEVLATCPSGQRAEVALTYLVGGAAWTPTYEARADENNGVVELSTWATVTQGTGEDWNQVELVLSTAVPTQNATPPELKRLLVSAQQREDEQKVLVRRDEVVARAQAGSAGDTTVEAGTRPVRAQGLSVQLVVPEAAVVPGTGAPVRLFVGRSRLKASFELRATPRLAPFAFRVAELTNLAPWPLLPGRVDVFRATGLVGRYPLERVAQGALFTLSFGLEDAVRVTRTVVEELKRDTGLFNDRKRFTYAYRFELVNFGQAPAVVALQDHVPVSELADISVTVGSKTTPGYTLDPQDGITRWKVSLRAGEKKAVNLAFQVDVPSSYQLGGL